MNAEAETLSAAGSGWYVDKVLLNGTAYNVDSRDYFIDFNKLVNVGLLEKIPASAAKDNAGGSESGSYSWYVNGNGRVTTLYAYFPSGGEGFSDNRGYIDGVYP
ncbi:MAG: hypothetical protein J4O03_05995 [Chloroflexi bacterium]|nr:hypothetical protein [Chloroflexota bacterium]MCH8348678.1 hypothetical protein [Chloroflexota bacterium]MCI0780682.1 hypothetical protein [Chloroflexota bacterium]MCI0784859.1 hypothetical protein [Chloroflexota bacterium]MCI0793004.1 hypothetical protein [Chloroflexota bacterium]